VCYLLSPGNKIKKKIYRYEMWEKILEKAKSQIWTNVSSKYIMNLKPQMEVRVLVCGWCDNFFHVYVTHLNGHSKIEHQVEILSN